MIFARDPYVRARKEYRGGLDALLSQTIALRPTPIGGENSTHGGNNINGVNNSRGVNNNRGASIRGVNNTRGARNQGENNTHWGVVEVHRDPLTGNWLVRFGDANKPMPTEESTQVMIPPTTLNHNTNASLNPNNVPYLTYPIYPY